MHILIVDISSVFWSIALAGTHADGNLPRDFTLKDIAQTGQYDRIVIAVDGDDTREDWPQKPWRRSIWPTYKAGREERAQHLWLALKDTIEHCAAAGYVIYRSPPKEAVSADDDGQPGIEIGHYEADDVIGSVVKWARAQGHTCDIRTNDSDLAQLIKDEAPQVRLIRKDKGKRIAMDATACFQWVGVPPHVVASLKAIAGDSSDGYGGKHSPYPGIGVETAKELLKAAKGNPIEAINMAIFSDEKTAKGESPKHVKIAAQIGIGAVEKALQLARVSKDLSLDFSLIEVEPVAAQPPSMPELQGGEVTEGEFEEIQKKIIAERDEARNRPSTALVIAEPPRMLLAPAELVQRDREVYALIQHALSYGPPDGKNDYGLIPGCGTKPALFDVGAERLAKVFGLYPRYKIIEKEVRLFGENPIVFYLVRCRVYRVGPDNQVGEAIAACNSNEKTFQRRDGKAPIFDLVHPVFTRAQKRAWVKAILRATGAQKYLSSGFDDLIDAEFGDAPSAPQWAQK